MVFAIVWQKRALAAGALLAATTLSIAGVTAAAGQQSPGSRGRGAGSAAGGALRHVTYRGHVFQIPRDWPVINLSGHPATCVRFDRHALYLGKPGSTQSCPSGLVGSTEAVLAEPASAGPASSRPASSGPASSGPASSGPASSGPASSGPASSGPASSGAAGARPAATEDPVAHRIVATAAGIQVTASYSADRAQVLAILAAAGLPAPAVQDPADIQLGSLSAVPAVRSAPPTSPGWVSTRAPPRTRPQ